MHLTWVERGLRTRFFSINTGQTRPEAGFHLSVQIVRGTDRSTASFRMEMAQLRL